MEDKIILAVIGVVAGFMGGIGKSWLDSRKQIDQSLRDARSNVYDLLWKMTGLLPEWPRAEDVTYEKLEELSRKMRNWYFNEGGGILLSANARDSYGEVQKAITGVLAQNKTGPVPPSHPHYEMIRKLCSAMRTQLTEDLHSRSRTLL